ncbi:putative RNA polymerase II subunit B1 CTD phosphatase RPAP2 isoform X3 [Dreissena polymorpha]|uniref:putative RNA polymerase II subunit B1 CTD phosphatase RPAP2 isoform X3 n=1 Tax=Dreissena polymorpha TaxID=45954 RepID=UPI002264DE5D|nr:putative RNA polymerase II subunit B1 CTD phosphatase RPAP2 isoform X3 [Dreissena polymorpha]
MTSVMTGKSESVMTGKSKEDKNAELRRKIEYQVACEEKAHRIVERLIENPVTGEALIDSLHFITASHYDDITVERAVSKLCGYPLCQNALGKVLKQKYMISTKTNKVYDIESRKNFCSAKCYKASKHLERQISNDPLWSRQKMPPRKYELLPLDMEKGRMGDEVLDTHHKKEMKKEVETLEKQDKYLQSLHKMLKKPETSQKLPVPNQDKLSKMGATKASVDEKDENIVEPVKDVAEDVCVYDLEKALEEFGIDDKAERKSGLGDRGKFKLFGLKTVSEATNNDCNMLTKPVDGNLPGCLVEDSVKGEKVSLKSEATEAILSEVVESVEGSTEDVNGEHVLKKTKGRSKAKVTNQTKTDYLMQLLNKRKSLLSKMVDIQDGGAATKCDEKAAKCEEKAAKCDGIQVIENASLTSCGADQLTNESSVTNATCGADENSYPCQVIETQTTLKSDSMDQLVSESRSVRISVTAKSEKDTAKVGVNVSKINKELNPEKQAEAVTDVPKNLVMMEFIYRCMKSWITQDTRKFMGCDKISKKSPPYDVNPEIQDKYKALVAKVDAQEKDFDRLLGDVSLEDEGTRPSAPLPHFEFLREEVLQHQQRVQHFMKGSFTYTVQEKPTAKEDQSQSVVLPTVDKYDQMLIRRKILLERLSKVLPDVLGPLHMLVQDVFTELRQLVFTFNLSNDNITFKPVEWTVVAVLLLKVLSSKLQSLKQAFSSPGAEQYFNILLSPLGENLATIEKYVNGIIK